MGDIGNVSFIVLNVEPYSDGAACDESLNNELVVIVPFSAVGIALSNCSLQSHRVCLFVHLRFM